MAQLPMQQPPYGKSPRILLVDDDPALCQLLADYLSAESFTVDTVNGGRAALAQLSAGKRYQTIVLDIMMPDLSGLDVLQSIRAEATTPVIMLTGRADDIDRILGLEMGADDYLAKPCNPRELAARIRATLRRWHLPVTGLPGAATASILKTRNITLDLKQRSVTVNGQALTLTSAEFNTLAILIQQQGQIVTRETLTEKVLQRKLSPYDRSIDVHISRIRQKLAPHTGQEALITTLRGRGYQFCGEI